MSTAKLPDEAEGLSGQSTGMNLKAILKRIEHRLKAEGLSADGASKEAKKPDAIRNMRRAIKEGRKGVNSDTIAALAPVLKTTSAWLLDGKGSEHGDDSDVRSEDVAASLKSRPAARMVKLKGYVGAGDRAHYYAVSDEDFAEVEAPEGYSDRTVAVEIKGKSFGPLLDSWLVFYDDVRSPVTADLHGEICVVGLDDDRILIKQIKPAKNGTYNLLSNGSEPPIEGVRIEWAAKVIGMRAR